MSVSRLNFLYPHLFRHSALAEATPLVHGGHPGCRRLQQRSFQTSRRYDYELQTQRYGTAKEPIPLPRPGEKLSQPLPQQHAKDQSIKEGLKEPTDSGVKARAKGEPKERNRDDVSERTGDRDTTEAEDRPRMMDAAESHPAEPVTETSLQVSQRPLERVLHIETPTSRGQGRPPHLRAPPYVHHFDTFSLVNDLTKGGYTQQQSITIMKAVRGLLAENMQLAREGLVSKSDVENESYLFRAACSELKTEVQNNRKAAADKLRSERAHLQHEVDILSQKVTQDTLNLKDELKGRFDDRKMVVRMEQRSMDSAIQELNYKIQSQLLGESKGEVEGLRWFLTRRAALFIASFVVLVLGSIRYSVHMSHVQQQERQKLQEAEDAKSLRHSKPGPSNYTTSSRSMATQTGDSTDAVLSSNDSSAGSNFVSLG